MHKGLKKYLPLIEFLGQVMGNNFEVVMHDLTDVDKSVVAISNNHISGRNVGAPATKLSVDFINNNKYKGKDYVLNYKGKNKEGKDLRSSTFFIRDDNEELIGMLCINVNIEDFNKIKNLVDSFVNFSTDQDVTEKFPNSLDEVANEYIDQLISDVIKNPEDMSTDKKIEVIKELNEKGAFSYKGMVVNVAKELKVSEPTVYRYLNKIKNIGGKNE